MSEHEEVTVGRVRCHVHKVPPGECFALHYPESEGVVFAEIESPRMKAPMLLPSVFEPGDPRRAPVGRTEPEYQGAPVWPLLVLLFGVMIVVAVAFVVAFA